MPSTAEDRDEILQLLYRYNHAIDHGEGEAWAQTFTEDGVFDVGGQVTTGRPALVEFAATVTGLRHVVTNPVVTVSGDTATVQAYLLMYKGTDLALVGSYADDVVRTADGWRFAKRVFTPEAS